MKKLTMVGILGMLLIAGTGKALEKGETSAAFLKLTGGSRPAGMGDCYIGLSDDASACYFNPAGLAQLEKKEGLFMLLRPMGNVDDLIMSFGALAIPLPYGVFGLSFTYYGYGEMDKITGEDNSNPVKNGKWSAYDFSLSSSFAKPIREDIDLGGSLKVINGKIDDANAIAFALDIGGLYKIKEGLQIGATIKNLGSKMTYEEEGFSLPLSLKLGVAYKLPENLRSILILSDLTIPNDNDPYLGIGCEYKPREIFSIRAGYKTGPQDEGPGFTLGLGTQYGLYNFDYAYQPFGKLGDNHRISILTRF